MSGNKTLNYASDRKYSETHEWVKMEGDVAVIGISDYAQDALGDVVFVELPTVGKSLKAGEQLGVVESVKAASDLFTPISGIIAAVNEKLSSAPETLNKDSLSEGWIAKLKPSNPSEMSKLMDAETYRGKIESGELH